MMRVAHPCKERLALNSFLRHGHLKVSKQLMEIVSLCCREHQIEFVCVANLNRESYWVGSYGKFKAKTFRLVVLAEREARFALRQWTNQFVRSRTQLKYNAGNAIS